MTRKRFVYPALYARLDLGIGRVNGAGLGNCLFTYCHAVIVAHDNDARVVAPAWRTLAISAKLRGRDFGRILRPHADEVAGMAKMALLARHVPAAARLEATAATTPSLRPGLTIVSAPFVFDGLHRHRAMLRDRLLGLLPRPQDARDWGRGDYLAIHVRLGDFDVASEQELDDGTVANLRIPMSWYVAIAERLRREVPEWPIKVFSNGTADDLAALLAIEGVDLAQEESDVADLLAMAGARLLVGSHSTFSQWAAFLGNMPTFWRARAVHPDRPTDRDVPLHFIGKGDEGWPDHASLVDMVR